MKMDSILTKSEQNALDSFENKSIFVITVLLTHNFRKFEQNDLRPDSPIDRTKSNKVMSELLAKKPAPFWISLNGIINGKCMQ